MQSLNTKQMAQREDMNKFGSKKLFDLRSLKQISNNKTDNKHKNKDKDKTQKEEQGKTKEEILTKENEGRDANKQNKISKRIFGRDIKNVVPNTKKQINSKNIDLAKQVKNKSLSIQKIITPRPKQQAAINKSPEYEAYKEQIIRYLLKLQKSEKLTSIKSNKSPAIISLDQGTEQQICNNMTQIARQKIKITKAQIRMRMIQSSINKMIILHHSLGLEEQTLYLALTYFKQYVSHLLPFDQTHLQSSLNQTQLDYTENRQVQDRLAEIGICCLWIASKYEQIYPPKPKYFLKFLQKDDLQQLKRTQQKIIQVIQFNFNRTTAYNFLLIICQQKNNIFCLANYIIQSLYYKDLYFNYPSSLLALSAVKIARYVYSKNIGSSLNIQSFAQHTKEDVSKCFRKLCQLLQPGSLRSGALKNKFSDASMYEVAKISLHPK